MFSKPIIVLRATIATVHSQRLNIVFRAPLYASFLIIAQTEATTNIGLAAAVAVGLEDEFEQTT